MFSEAAIVGGLYFCLARIALLFAWQDTNASPYWVPAGLGLFATLLFGVRAWPGLALGAAVANFTLFVGQGESVEPLLEAVAAALIGCGNATAALVCWLVLGRPLLGAGFRLGLPEVGRWILGSVAASALAASVGTGVVVTFGFVPAAAATGVWSIWTGGDLVGYLAVAPWFLSLWSGSGDGETRRSVVSGCYAALLGLTTLQILHPDPPDPVLVAVLALPIVGGLTRSVRHFWTLLVLAAALVAWQGELGQGPFASPEPSETMLRIQLWVLVLSVLGLAAWARRGVAIATRTGLRMLAAPAGASSLAVRGAVAVFLAGAVLSSLVWLAVLRDAETRQARETLDLARRLADVASAEFDHAARAVERMADRWNATDGIPEDLWRRDVRAYTEDFGFFQALEIVSADFRVEWIEPLVGNEEALGLDLSTEGRRRDALLRARDGSRITISRPIELKQGGRGTLLVCPLQRPEPGFMVAVFRYDRLMTSLFERVGGLVESREALQLLRVVDRDGTVLYQKDPASRVARRRMAAVSFRLGGQELTLEVTPSREAARRSRSPVPDLALSAGLLASFGLGLGVFLVFTARDRAREANLAAEAKARFLAVMSHEIRTPLNGVLGAAQLLARGGLDDEQRDQVRMIESSGRTLLALLDDVLDFSRLESDRVEIERSPVDLREIVADTHRMVAPAARERSVELGAKVSDALPKWIVGDAVRLGQILLNLVSNGVKFSSGGRVDVEVEVRDGPGPPTYLIAVADTGIGMDEATVERIFTPFTQSDASTTRRFGGSGLGLSITRQLVELMRGTIRVKTAPGAGSRFLVELPLERPRPPSGEVDTGAGRIGEPLPELRVLLVEDSEINRMIGASMLRHCGCRVEMAEDGAEGVARALAEEFDLVLMDVRMPLMDGWAAARRIREATNGVPIALMTADAEAATDPRGAELGLLPAITKPVELERLRETLERVAAGRAQSD